MAVGGWSAAVRADGSPSKFALGPRGMLTKDLGECQSRHGTYSYGGFGKSILENRAFIDQSLEKKLLSTEFAMTAF
jgi:hypothetical protein